MIIQSRNNFQNRKQNQEYKDLGCLTIGENTSVDLSSKLPKAWSVLRTNTTPFQEVGFLNTFEPFNGSLNTISTIPFSQPFTSHNPPRDVYLNLGNTVVPSEEEYSCNKNVVID